MTIDLAALAAEFPKEAIHWRAQKLSKKGDKAMALAYLDARDVMDRLDAVCGPANWPSQYSETAKGRVLCSLGIRIDGEWVWKTDGAGNTAVEAEKGGISDALKRAAVSWGIGRYLYRIEAPWVPCETFNNKWSKWSADPWRFVREPRKFAAPPAPEPDAAQPDPEAQWFRATLPDVTTADEINALLPRAKAAGKDVGKLVVARANELGLDFDPQARRYMAREAA